VTPNDQGERRATRIGTTLALLITAAITGSIATSLFIYAWWGI
jgi:hypothetical protein